MDQDANISDNIGFDPAPIPRRPGRPKGLPKPPGSGRQKGVTNRVTKDIREAAGKHGVKALAALVKLLDNSDPKIVATAAREVLDRAYGKPMQPSEVSGANGAPLIPDEMTYRERAQKLLFFLAKARAEVVPEGTPFPKTLDQLTSEISGVYPARAVVIDAATIDPFAAQRAEQAADIARVIEAEPLPTPPPGPGSYEARQAAYWSVHGAHGSLEQHGLKPAFPRVVSIDPSRHRKP